MFNTISIKPTFTSVVAVVFLTDDKLTLGAVLDVIVRVDDTTLLLFVSFVCLVVVLEEVSLVDDDSGTRGVAAVFVTLDSGLVVVVFDAKVLAGLVAVVLDADLK